MSPVEALREEMDALESLYDAASMYKIQISKPLSPGNRDLVDARMRLFCAISAIDRLRR